MIEKDSKYEDHVCQFDLKRLKLADIIGEDFHPSLNFNFMSEKAMLFLDQNVILAANIDSLSMTQFVLKRVAKLPKEKFQTLFLLNGGLVYAIQQIFFPFEISWTRDQYELLRTFLTKYGNNVVDIDPFADNLIVFYLYKTLSLAFAAYHDMFGPTPEINRILMNLPSYDENSHLYQVVLVSISLFLQFAFIVVPLTFIVETIYKKGSPIFRVVPILTCITAVVLLSVSEILLDY